MKPTPQAFIACACAALVFHLTGITVAQEAAPAQKIAPSALAQIAALQMEKASRTPAQKKLDSHLVHAARMQRGEAIAPGVATLQTNVKPVVDGRVLVDIKATVTPALLEAITGAGGTVVSSFPAFNAVRAWLSLTEMEGIAGRGDVRFIRPAEVATTHHYIPENADDGANLAGPVTNTGSVTSEGDAAHAAATARATFGVDGTGVKIGVLSDSVTGLANAQATGNVPASLTVLAGQAGTGAGEGTAMLEIVHDIAPGAQLFFATANGGPANMAQNILNLRTAGCDIIIDDITYPFDDGPFQDGLISKAVNSVSASGALYFSSAANSGNKNDGTSSTYESDFVDGGPATGVLTGAGTFHDFGGQIYNPVTKAASNGYLFWADPLGGSTNDYDLYLLDSTGSFIIDSGTNPQDGTQDPMESLGSMAVGQILVVVKFSGANRFLHLDIFRGHLGINTQGSTRGHNASGAANAFCVAATDATTSAPSAFTGGATNPVENFSSDGPRRVFFTAAGAAITPGNFSSTGGQVLQKPDITAADGVQCITSGFNPFFGTSAAAPHAGALAALLKQFKPTLTPAEMRALLQDTALDIEAPGFDRDSGAGIIMADRFLQGTASAPIISVTPLATTLTKSDHREIFVELDWMDNGAGLSFKPSQAVLDRITATFARDGYTIHIELGNAVPYKSVLNITTFTPMSASTDVANIVNANFNHSGDSRYFYSIWCADYAVNGTNTHSSGIADLPGRVHLISLGSFSGGVGTENNKVGTFIHEFGHNLNQFHGGTDHVNYKPNYISVMNYQYQLDGIGAELFAKGWASSSSGLNNFGYSHGTLQDLNENNLNENVGLGLGTAIDWNANGSSTQTGVVKDLNNDGSLAVLSDFDNWGGIAANVRALVVMPLTGMPIHPSERCITAPEYQVQKQLLDAARAKRGEDPGPQVENVNGVVPTGGFTISNSGSGSLVINSITPATSAPWLSVSPTFPMTIPAGTSRYIAVAADFTISPPGTTTTRLLINSNDTTNTPYNGAFFVTVNSTAVNTEPEIEVRNPNGGIVGDGYSSVGMGATLVNNMITRTFTIKNIGDAPLQNLFISKDGLNAGDFSFTQPLMNSVAGGAETTFTVTFKPTFRNIRFAKIHIANNDSDENPFDITLTGTGLAPEIEVRNPNGGIVGDGYSSVGMGATLVNNMITRTFTIKNIGNALLQNLAITKDGLNAGDFTFTQPLVNSVAGGANTTFTVTFKPTFRNIRFATLHIANNDSDENPFDITLTGTGLAPEIDVMNPNGGNLADGFSSVGLGAVKVNTEVTRTFTIKNSGNALLNNLAITKDGAHPAEFTVAQPLVTSLAGGASTTFTVKFKPTATGSRFAKIHIANNDSDENPFDISLTGTGVTALAGAGDLKTLLGLDPSGSEQESAAGGKYQKTTTEEWVDGHKYLALAIKKPAGGLDSKLHVEVSPDRLDWYSGRNHTTVMQDDTEWLKVRDNTPLKPGTKRFIHLK